jgi:hypothetical protein
MEEDDVCIVFEVDEAEDAAALVTAVDPTEKVVERLAGAGSSKISFRGRVAVD